MYIKIQKKIRHPIKLNLCSLNVARQILIVCNIRVNESEIKEAGMGFEEVKNEAKKRKARGWNKVKSN